MIKVSSAVRADAAPPLARADSRSPPDSGATVHDRADRDERDSRVSHDLGRTSYVRVTTDDMSSLSDRDLVDRAREGDRRAFGELVRRHQRRIHRLALHMLRDRAEAEDVTQETFVRAYNAIARFDGRSEPFTWLYRIAVNLSLNALRSRKSSRVSASLDSDPRLEAVAQAAASEPAADAAQRELYTALSEAVDALSETLRTTLILVCIDGRSHEEASQILGAPEGTIAWRVHEARRKLKEGLAARGFELELASTPGPRGPRGERGPT